MAKTKNQIARQKYGCSFDDLNGGQKAAVSRAFNDQETEYEYDDVEEDDGFITVTFKRPGNVKPKAVSVASGTTLEEALKQAGVTLVASKEGVQEKISGDTIKFSDTLENGKTYLILPGIESSL